MKFEKIPSRKEIVLEKRNYANVEYIGDETRLFKSYDDLYNKIEEFIVNKDETRFKESVKLYKKGLAYIELMGIYHFNNKYTNLVNKYNEIIRKKLLELRNLYSADNERKKVTNTKLLTTIGTENKKNLNSFYNEVNDYKIKELEKLNITKRIWKQNRY